ncbi:LutC/YkgG family protein [Gordonia sp. SL306]|uniref:LutC/YkgG family protein n=1 Tax=Gordonia sp. SL306 TaxID=2995145 RepID=UPI00226E8B85|nr:LUD domain-containing protein [Gordonia sp. SL306]WAC54252.1 LUD domain-containing protein [Gordonia sp. SL306]
MSAREDILGRIRTALDDVSDPHVDETPVDWAYGQTVSTGDLGLIDRFAERVADYRAAVEQVSAADLDAALTAALSGVSGAIVADDVVRRRLGVDLEWRNDDGLSPADLDGVGAVVTTAAVAMANTGTIVLDHGPGQGRRAVSLVPDVHVCIVDKDQVVGDVPEAVARLVETGAHTHPQTWISGPSATSDIELDRVEGVHGPRTLHVLIVG